jgi:carbon-monoxide dehydrogenase iron sulfur subunit
MPKSVAAIPERCVGCKLCQLICSYVTLRVFNPTRSHLTIKADEKRGLFDIEFLPECTDCGACIKYCPSEALIGDVSFSEKEHWDG